MRFSSTKTTVTKVELSGQRKTTTTTTTESIEEGSRDAAAKDWNAAVDDLEASIAKTLRGLRIQ